MTDTAQSTIASRIMQAVRANATGQEGTWSKRRPMGTLDPKIMWDPGNRKEGIPPALASGAMPFYRNLVRQPKANGQGAPRRTGMQAWGALVVALAYPSLRQLPAPDKHERKVYRKVWAKISEAWTARQVHDQVSVRKNIDSFSVKVPVFHASTGAIEGLRQYYCGNDGNRQDGDHFADHPFSLHPGRYMAAMIPKTHGLFDRYIPWMMRATNCFIEVKANAGAYTVFLCLDFSQQEATVLCQTSWLEIRPIDFYALMHTWAAGRVGSTRADPPIYSHPMSRIARELPEGAEKRVSKDLNILVDQYSHYWWIEDKNNISSFEGDYARHLKRADGTLCAHSDDPINDPVQNPPKSGLVFVDWVNLKMAYINAEGRMEVIGLDRAIPATPTHYVRWMNAGIASGLGLQVITQTMNIAQFIGFNPTAYKGPKELIEDLLKEPQLEGYKAEDISFQDMNMATGCQAAWDFKRAVDLVLSYADSSVENLYARYAYKTVSQLIAYLKILKVFLPKYHETVAEDRTLREAYLTQDVKDPDFELRQVPYMREADENGEGGRALMPHQVRGAQRLAKSPNFAILAVDAGGGKTASCIYDFLKELGNGNVRRGLILCPTHLVAQYVKEFLYFTDGRVNVIAITTYTMRTHKGLANLALMLEKAPPNTVVVSDYDLARGSAKSKSMGYGPTPTKYYPVVEMLRSFAFDYVFCDESHFLKGTTGRQAAVSRLISDIPYKRLASGTLAPNQITDLLQQIALLDPTVMPRGEFLNKYALEMRGDKVVRWKPGYEAQLMAELKQHIVWVQTKRKEWAALLPMLLEEGHPCELTNAQAGVYRTILDEIVENLRKEMASNKLLRALLTGKMGGDDEDPDAEGDDDGDDEGDEDAADPGTVDIDALLKPYLARLEQFTVAPAADPYGTTVLTGDDRISPKVKKIEEIIRKHIANATPGKILIFTNFKASAEAIYEGLSPDLKKMAIHYTASNKEADGAQFERDDSKLIMVGVEVSMNTGLNLQFCSRLIRADSVWTPGSLEQGNSRIQRPNIKKAEDRTTVYIDWIIANRTIDVTKQAFLLQKQVTIAKFDEADNPAFKRIELPPAFPMSLDVIRTSDRADSEELVPYFAAYHEVMTQTFLEYEKYKEEHPEDLDPVTGGMKMERLKRGPNQPNAKLMYRLPYVPGTELYKAEDLGLVRYDAFLKLDIDENDEDDSEVESEGQRALSKAELAKVQGLAVHTEFGDGNIVGLSKKKVTVELASGGTVKVSKVAAFIITRAQTNNKDMREALLRQIGDVEYDKPFDVEVKDARKVVLPKKEQRVQEDEDTISVTLELVVTNDIIGLKMENAEANPRGAAALEAFGFHQPAPYYFAELPNADYMYRQFEKWHKAGFYFDKASSDACKRLYINLRNARKNAATMIGQSHASDIRNFYMLNRKPDPDKERLYPYPLIEDDVLYLALPITGHPASAMAIRHRIAGVDWGKADVENERIVLMPNLGALDRNMPRLLNQGIVVTNLDELIRRRKKLRVKYGNILEGK